MKIRNLNPATVIATIALLFALTGTAVAGGLVTGANILNGSIASIDVMNESLRTVDVKNKNFNTATSLNVNTLKTGDVINSNVNANSQTLNLGRPSPPVLEPLAR